MKKELLEKYFTNELAQFVQYHEAFLRDNKCQNFYFDEKVCLKQKLLLLIYKTSGYKK